ncbi:MAG: DJ-1 family glyoxalase III [Candidatus Omnitrophota bacterium]
MKKILIILAEGFEEAEAVIPIDIFRRLGIETVIAGLDDNFVTGSHGIVIKTDVLFENYSELPDAVVFPGGMPGAENLANSTKVKSLISRMNSAKKLIAAICASPALVLAPTGVLNAKTATCYPGLEKNFSSTIKFSEEKVVQDGNIITSRGAGTVFEFGLKIAENIVGKAKSDMTAQQMLYP